MVECENLSVVDKRTSESIIDPPTTLLGMPLVRARGIHLTEPTVAAHPLFDSFAIDLGQRTVTISVFRMAMSSRHGRSTEGY